MTTWPSLPPSKIYSGNGAKRHMPDRLARSKEAHPIPLGEQAPTIPPSPSATSSSTLPGSDLLVTANPLPLPRPELLANANPLPRPELLVTPTAMPTPELLVTAQPSPASFWSEPPSNSASNPSSRPHSRLGPPRHNVPYPIDSWTYISLGYH
eukprot:jgi/Psemu1/61994/gm1.61994_g